jgi:hypothetical protein
MPKQSAKSLLKSFGDTISTKELKRFENAGYNIDRAKNYAKNTGGVSFNTGAKSYYSAGKSSSTTSPSSSSNSNSPVTDPYAGMSSWNGEWMSQDEFTYKSLYGLKELDGQIQTNLQNLLNQGNAAVAGIGAEANKYAAKLDADARKYVADATGKSLQEVEKIRGKSNIDLQGIINAGLKDVENIRGTFGVEQEKTRGEFNVKQEETRQIGSRDIARIGGRAGIYQGLMGAFSF